MRAGSFLWLYLVVTGLAACWNWSFDGDLLERDSGLPDAAVDLATDVAADLPADGADAAGEAGPDLVPPDLPPDTAKWCPPCSGTTPLCDSTTGACRGCESHTECTGAVSDGELCAADGSCPSAQNITYVDSNPTSCTNDQGTQADPYCAIDDAIGETPKYVLVRKNAAGAKYGDFTVDSSHEIYAEPGTVVQLSDCGKLLLKGGATIRLQGFEIQGNVTITEGSKVTLVQNTIGPSACVGVTATGGSTVKLQRNLVRKNTLGGIMIAGTYTVQNNIIVQNSSGAENYGGVKLTPADLSTCTFINNTVADNSCKSSNAKEACGVRCETSGTKLVNNLFWSNGFNKTGVLADDRQYSNDCVAEHSLEQLKAGASPTGTGNITATDPGFAGTTPSMSAADYFLTPGSAAVGKANAAVAPQVDYQGQTRDAAKPDIGADEHVP